MALKDAPIVKVRKFDEKEAYNPDRQISGLIRNQLLHLHHAEYLLVPPPARTNININNLLTEREASEYIHKVTILLRKHGKTKPTVKAKKKAALKTVAKKSVAKKAVAKKKTAAPKSKGKKKSR